MIFHGKIYPLRVLKQVAGLFFASCGPAFQSKHRELARFVLDPESQALPPDYDFRVFWYGGGELRQSGVTGVMNAETGDLNVVAEFVHPPFGYVLSLGGQLADRRPESISNFAQFRLNERVSLRRRLPVLQTHWMMPGDYRTEEQIQRDFTINTLHELGVPNPGALLDEYERGGG